jgi:hypothetical protein
LYGLDIPNQLFSIHVIPDQLKEQRLPRPIVRVLKAPIMAVVVASTPKVDRSGRLRLSERLMRSGANGLTL